MTENAEGHKKTMIVSMVKDEADIIELFIRYHLQFIDYLIILDNFSADETVNIIRKLQHEYSNLYLILDEDREYRQAEKTSRLVQKALHLVPADIIIPLDADEFLDFEISLEDLHRYFDQMRDDVVYYNVSYFCFMRDFYRMEFFPGHLEYQYDDENYSQKVMITTGLWRERKIVFSEGNHTITEPVDNIYAPVGQLDKLKNYGNSLIDSGDYAKAIKDVSQQDIKNVQNNLQDLQYATESQIRILHFAARSLNQEKSKSLLQALNLTARLHGFITGKGYQEAYYHLEKYKSNEEWLADRVKTLTKWQLWQVYKLSDTVYPIKGCTDTKVNYTQNLLKYGMQLGEDYVSIKKSQKVLKDELLEVLLLHLLSGYRIEKTIHKLMQNFTLQECSVFMECSENGEIRENMDNLIECLPRYAMEFCPDLVPAWFA